jgi:hypothetical protein
MNPDIITSAPRLPLPIEAAPAAEEPGELRGVLDAVARLLRSQAESLARLLILSIASAPPLRALEAFLDRCVSTDEATQQAVEARAAAHALRVRARLTEREQRRFDELLAEGELEPMLASIVRRTEDESLELVRRELGGLEPSFSAASLARQIGAVRGLLTDEEYDRVIMRLPYFSPEQLQVLNAHLRAMTPADAAMLLRSYLRPVRS